MTRTLAQPAQRQKPVVKPVKTQQSSRNGIARKSASALEFRRVLFRSWDNNRWAFPHKRCTTSSPLAA